MRPTTQIKDSVESANLFVAWVKETGQSHWERLSGPLPESTARQIAQAHLIKYGGFGMEVDCLWYSGKAFVIEDWTGKVCFFGKEFPTFEDAWGFIRRREPEEAWQEYYVEEKK